MTFSCARFLALLCGLALQCAVAGAHAGTGTANGRVRNATTLDPATTGSVALEINGVPWGQQAAIDGSGLFDFGTVVWAGTGSASCKFLTSGTGFIDGGTTLLLASGGSVFADILLAPGSAISGVVTDSATALPIPTGSVLVFDAGGVLLGSAAANAQGAYKYGGLVAGTSYYARTDFPDYLDQLWQGIPCPNGDCTVTSGTAILFPDDNSSVVADFQLDLDLIFANGFQTTP